jgi:hypothetical protein
MTAKTLPYDNPSTMLEKKETLQNDQRATSTFFDQSRIAAALEEGRKALANIHSGSEKFVAYPPLDPNSPWGANSNPGQEPPLGVDVNFVEPCGEHFEVQRSLVQAQSANGGLTPPSLPEGNADAGQGAIPTAGVSALSSASPLTPASGDAAAPAIQQSAQIPLSSAGAIHSSTVIRRRRFLTC